MNIEVLRSYCLSKKATTEEFPFDEHTLVYKVMGKIYAITSLNREEIWVNLKCDPDKAILLRDEYDDIIPGYHMNKRHWNTVYTERGLDDKTIYDLIDHSYDLIIEGLPKKLRAEWSLL